MNIKEVKLVCPEVKNWFFTELPSSNPFALKVVLLGKVYGSSKFEDGTSIRTSRIRYFVCDGEDILVKTKNSVYRICRNEAYPNTFGDENWENLLKVCVKGELV